MADIFFNSIRLQQKYEEEKIWNTGIDFVPLRGEVIVYGTDDEHEYPRIKIGDANGTTIGNLPFINEKISDEELDEIWNNVIDELKITNK